jgi:antitoxin MazE
MVKTLSAVGNSLALIIERPILDLLGIDKETPLQIKTDGASLIITPLDKKKRVREAVTRAMKVHEKTLRELAK